MRTLPWPFTVCRPPRSSSVPFVCGVGGERGKGRSPFWFAKKCSIEALNGVIIPIPSISRLSEHVR